MVISVPVILSSRALAVSCGVQPISVQAPPNMTEQASGSTMFCCLILEEVRHTLSTMDMKAARMAVFARNLERTPATMQLAMRKSFSFPWERWMTRRPMICAAPVLNMASPTIMALAIRMTMLLEKPENASSKGHTPSSTMSTSPRQPTAEAGIGLVIKSIMTSARIRSAVTDGAGIVPPRLFYLFRRWSIRRPLREAGR